ncbi:hypothetical protein B0H10DRAFT_2190986 [Mycena sp. CBHHK59/15]|nr:hypothetical protein B0H10DRAFT_2190986 [Mycena sp. CBHHK59/15]
MTQPISHHTSLYPSIKAAVKHQMTAMQVLPNEWLYRMALLADPLLHFLEALSIFEILEEATGGTCKKTKKRRKAELVKLLMQLLQAHDRSVSDRGLIGVQYNIPMASSIMFGKSLTWVQWPPFVRVCRTDVNAPPTVFGHLAHGLFIVRLPDEHYRVFWMPGLRAVPGSSTKGLSAKTLDSGIMGRAKGSNCERERGPRVMDSRYIRVNIQYGWDGVHWRDSRQ